MLFPIILVVLLGPGIFTGISFIFFLFTGNRLFNKIFDCILDVLVMVGLPAFYFIVVDEKNNDCCNDSATFSPDHRVTIYILTLISVAAYFISRYKPRSSGPLVEVLLNTLLLLGIVFNIFVAIQVDNFIFLFGNLPIVLLFVMLLTENHKAFLASYNDVQPASQRAFEKTAWRIMTLHPLLKFPVLLVLCLPVLTVLMCLLLLFGQKPDSMIRAFTDTYKHGFSQLDYMCDNVNCGGHFLCSVAANGHRGVVKPLRYGERNNNKIICNRQLLVANAFEELIEQKLPRLHRMIRRNYNKVGDVIHRYYGVFNNKFVADMVYVFMKPLEWFFLLALYAFDTQPENRIAQQYLHRLDRQKIREQSKQNRSFSS